MHSPIRARSRSSVLQLCLGIALAPLACGAAAAPRAQLVHCGAATCLRLTGSRAHAAVEVRVAGRAVAVEGARAWRATLPIEAVRGGVDASGTTLAVTLADPRTGVDHAEAAILPPGALGRPIELASLIVSAH